MARLVFRLVDKVQGLELSPSDAEALSDFVSWHRPPEFAVPGRTAWYVLRDPVQAPDGRTLSAVKLKGVGVWNPAESSIRSGIRGKYPVGVSMPSTDEYEETSRALHFGIDGHGAFSLVHSEPAPFGAIVLRRARQEYENARILDAAGVPAIVPYALYSYGDDRRFNGEPLGVVASLAPDPCPHSLEFLLLAQKNAGPEQLAQQRAVRQKLGLADGDATSEAAALAAINEVAFQIGGLMRRMAQAGLYRYSAGWDNFYFDRSSGAVYLTDLDSTRQLSTIPHQFRGVQVMRDAAGALFRLANKLYHPSNVERYHLYPMLDVNPLASLVSGYFAMDRAAAREVVAPLWRYFVPHWFLLKRHERELAVWPDDRRKSYKLDKELFHCLSILALARVYRDSGESLGLPPVPPVDELCRRARDFLGERMDLLELLWDRDNIWAHPAPMARPSTPSAGAKRELPPPHDGAPSLHSFHDAAEPA